MPDDASLGLRNAGRGFLGGALGSVAGGNIGDAIGISINSKRTVPVGQHITRTLKSIGLTPPSKIPLSRLIGYSGGSIIGNGLASKFFTDKYSKENAKEILTRKQLN